MAEWQDPNVLFARGHYPAALRALRADQSRRPLSVAEHVLLAELLSLTEATDAALREARQLVKQRSLSVRQRCRVRGVLAETLFRNGQPEKATDQYASAIELAERHNEVFEECRLRVRLFRSQIHWLGPYQAAADVTTLLRKAYHLADPSISVVLQLGLTQLAAKLALLPRAHRHLETAKALLPQVENRSLHADAKIAELALAGYESNYAEALKHTLDLIPLMEETGSRTYVLHVNAGHLFLTQGRFEEALEWLERGLAERAWGPDLEVLLTNNLMELRLAQGLLDETGALANSIEQMLKRREGADPYHGFDYLITRVRWLYRTGQFDAGLATATAAIPPMQQMADQNLLYRMRMLVAEGLGRTGSAAKGAALVAAALRDHPSPSVETVAETLRVTAGLVAAENPAGAINRFRRAIRILDALGSRAGVLEVDRDAVEALKDSLQMPTVTDRPPSHVAKESFEVDGTTLRETLIDQLATLVALGSRPDVLASEALELLAETGMVRKACVVETDGNGRTRTLSTFPRNADASFAADLSDIVCIGIKDHQPRHYEIRASPQPNATARATVLAIERLVNTAMAVARAHQIDREQAACWPDQTPEQQLGLICISERMLDLVKTIRRVASTTVPVLITGETGVGKELFARALHQASLRHQQVFLPFNCTTVPREMIDSQLFGHRRGAFTGAQEDAPGLIRAAAGGTLFLDEIGEMSSEAQPKLLRFLESGEILPLGERRPVSVDVRMVAATNANLDELVAQGRFREDLFYRLNVIRIHVPPLRERREEVPALVQHFLDRYGREFQRPMLRVADETLEYLVLFRWPGNVRQLANEVRRMVALAEPGAVLMPEHLSAEIVASRRTLPTERSLLPKEVLTRIDQPLSAITEHVERAAIQRALTVCEGNYEDAAKMLGLSRKGLYLKRQRLGLE